MQVGIRHITHRVLPYGEHCTHTKAVNVDLGHVGCIAHRVAQLAIDHAAIAHIAIIVLDAGHAVAPRQQGRRGQAEGRVAHRDFLQGMIGVAQLDVNLMMSFQCGRYEIVVGRHIVECDRLNVVARSLNGDIKHRLTVSESLNLLFSSQEHGHKRIQLQAVRQESNARINPEYHRCIGSGSAQTTRSRVERFTGIGIAPRLVGAVKRWQSVQGAQSAAQAVLVAGLGSGYVPKRLYHGERQLALVHDAATVVVRAGHGYSIRRHRGLHNQVLGTVIVSNVPQHAQCLA